MRHTVSAVVLLSALWLLNSGLYKAVILVLGTLSVIFVIRIAHRMDVLDHEAFPLHLTARVFPYYGWLLKKIVQANYDVLKLIWSPSAKLSPCVSRVHSSQQTDIGKVIHANSLTLTPGTVTIDIQDDQFLVHALTREAMKEAQSGEMDRRVSEVER